MCGRYSLAGPGPTQLRARFPLGESVDLQRRFNVCPDDEIAAVTTTREGEPRGELLRWGLVPHWSKGPGSGPKMINARAETLTERPAYRDSLKTRRCLIVADGFYEWQPREGRSKLPWHVTRSDGEPFAFAGLWAIWHGEGDETLRTATIITTQPNSVLAEIHDRMPVILNGPDEEAAWLEHGTSQDALLELLSPLADELTAPRPVSTAVNDAHNDTAQCLEDPDPAELAPVATGLPSTGRKPPGDVPGASLKLF
jgi:putative SOS response-associated peptidase YedK